MREQLLFTLTKDTRLSPIPTVTVDFTPPTAPVYTSPSHTRLSSSIIPSFNSDQLHFTPAFLLPKDAVIQLLGRSSISKIALSSKSSSMSAFKMHMRNPSIR